MPAAIPFVTAASSIASLAGGLKGSKGGGGGTQQTSSVQGFEALPQVIKDAYLEKFLPGALSQFQNGPTPGPLGRAQEGRFASKGLQELQQYADRLSQLRYEQDAARNGQQQPLQQAPQMGNALTGQNPGQQQIPNMPNGPNQQYPTNSQQSYNVGNNQNPNFAKGDTHYLGQQVNNDYLQGNGNGIRPLGSVEPLNELQTNALDQFGQGQNPASIESYLNPFAAQGLGNLSSALGSFGQQAGNQSNYGDQLSGYMNPYTQNVIDATLKRMQQQLAGGEQSILGSTHRLGGLGAFGSSALGTLLGNRQNEALQRAQEFVAGQNQANFGQAQQQRNFDLQNLIHSGNASYGQAGQLQNQGFGQRRQTLQDMLSAGNQVQQQNQNELSAVNPLIQQQLPQNRLSQLGATLAQFPGTQQSFNYAPAQPNGLQRFGAAGLGAANAFQSFQNAGLPQGAQNLGNSMPWLQSPGVGGISSFIG